ncbi:MAG: ABC transporter ATP-binding protein [Caldilineae bacterium]|nr:MAG: ABC transporter ATP-binding protein [Caldilineae bacterium]
MLIINELDVYYNHIHALHQVSLNVGESEAVAVLGANGAGKSTLIKSVMGWVKPQGGSIVLDGEEIHALPPWERVQRGIALAPEGARLFGDLSVEANLRLGGYLQSEEILRAQRETVFELFPVLAERRNQLAKTLSGGEQQMLSIARALMSRPRLLLIDEVSMGLMPILVKRVFNVIDRLRRQGVSILLVEQNAYESLKVVDRAYVLENGRIVLEGTPAELREDPRVRAAYLGG